MFFFFFQAEDGIRDYKVTGVQTCALPISHHGALAAIIGNQHAAHDPLALYRLLANLLPADDQQITAIRTETRLREARRLVADPFHEVAGTRVVYRHHVMKRVD